jgi:opacity protein-like surface antigen
VKKYLTIIAVGCFLSVPASGICAEEGYEANFNMFVGGKFLNSDWDDVDKHGAYGIQYDFTRSEWPVCVAVDYFFSKEGEAGIDGETHEFHVGVRQYLNRGSQFQPYLGAGAAYIKADVDGVVIDDVVSSDSDSALGVWFEGGIKWMAGEHFNVGLDVQYTRAETTIFNEDMEAGGILAGMTVGWRW